MCSTKGFTKDGKVVHACTGDCKDLAPMAPSYFDTIMEEYRCVSPVEKILVTSKVDYSKVDRAA